MPSPKTESLPAPTTSVDFSTYMKWEIERLNLHPPSQYRHLDQRCRRNAVDIQLPPPEEYPLAGQGNGEPYKSILPYFYGGKRLSTFNTQLSNQNELVILDSCRQQTDVILRDMRMVSRSENLTTEGQYGGRFRIEGAFESGGHGLCALRAFLTALAQDGICINDQETLEKMVAETYCRSFEPQTLADVPPIVSDIVVVPIGLDDSFKSEMPQFIHFQNAIYHHAIYIGIRGNFEIASHYVALNVTQLKNQHKSPSTCPGGGQPRIAVEKQKTEPYIPRFHQRPHRDVDMAISFYNWIRNLAAVVAIGFLAFSMLLDYGFYKVGIGSRLSLPVKACVVLSTAPVLLLLIPAVRRWCNMLRLRVVDVLLLVLCSFMMWRHVILLLPSLLIHVLRFILTGRL